MKQVTIPNRAARWIVYGLLACGLYFLGQRNLVPRYPEQHFTFLADSFLKGHLYFVQMPGYWDDTSLYEGQHYWPLGPLPAIVLLPFVAIFGMAFQQGYLLFVINLAILYLLYRIATNLTEDRTTAVWLGFGYIFSTCYLYVALRPWSWYFAQAVATLFALFALNEFFFRRRYWLIGIYVALAVATRVNLLFSLVFFVGWILLEANQSPRKILMLGELLLPVVVALAALLLYNYLRFGSVFEFGYQYQLLNHEPAVNRQYGLWSFIHFPTNLFYFLFKGPEPVFLPESTVSAYPYLQPNIWGMSIIFTSPILLWGLRAPIREKAVHLSLAASFVMLVSILGYYGVGVRQYGYRYALDFYPFLYVMLAYVSRNGITAPMRAVMVVSFIFNVYLISLM